MTAPHAGINVVVLLASGRLVDHEVLIRDTARRTLSSAADLIPIGHVDVVVYDNPRGVIPEVGIGGHAIGSHTIMITIDPDHALFDEVLTSGLPQTLAREAHHVARSQQARSRTLLESLYSRGSLSGSQSSSPEGRRLLGRLPSTPAP